MLARVPAARGRDAYRRQPWGTRGPLAQRRQDPGTQQRAVSYGANGAVRVCDVHADGYGVAVRYYRRAGNLQTLSNSKGNGTCSETTDIPSNPIALFEACVVIDSIPYCAPFYADTGR
ncbi:hypothetical protein ACFVXE_28045 [Streptomyces sp. NPDC058231]|uniref:hypothetical protein n=1 Tax=Streptomyces sp. NPDC058231 TaxID=3346392 RepID=UPI0036E711A0